MPPNSRTEGKAGEGRSFRFAALPTPVLVPAMTNVFLKVLNEGKPSLAECTFSMQLA